MPSGFAYNISNELSSASRTCISPCSCMESDRERTCPHGHQEGNQSLGSAHKGPDDVDLLVGCLRIKDIQENVVEGDKGLTSTQPHP